MSHILIEDELARRARPDCLICGGTGVYQYDENHASICDKCCRHDRGFFMLGEGYGHLTGAWCCLAGCGFTLPFNPDAAR